MTDGRLLATVPACIDKGGASSADPSVMFVQAGGKEQWQKSGYIIQGINKSAIWQVLTNGRVRSRKRVGTCFFSQGGNPTMGWILDEITGEKLDTGSYRARKQTIKTMVDKDHGRDTQGQHDRATRLRDESSSTCRVRIWGSANLNTFAPLPKTLLVVRFWASLWRTLQRNL